MSMVPLSDIPSLIQAVGTLRAAADLLGMSSQSLWNAKKRGYLPRRDVLVQRERLAAAGFDAPWTMWGMTEAPQQPAEAAA